MCISSDQLVQNEVSVPFTLTTLSVCASIYIRSSTCIVLSVFITSFSVYWHHIFWHLWLQCWQAAAVEVPPLLWVLRYPAGGSSIPSSGSAAQTGSLLLICCEPDRRYRGTTSAPETWGLQGHLHGDPECQHQCWAHSTWLWRGGGGSRTPFLCSRKSPSAVRCETAFCVLRRCVQGFSLSNQNLPRL